MFPKIYKKVKLQEFKNNFTYFNGDFFSILYRAKII